MNSRMNLPLVVLIVFASLPTPQLRAAPAYGLGVNVPVVSRTVGSGNTLYVTAMDISNNNSSDTQVDLYFNGTNLRTQTPIAVKASVTNDGFTAHGSGVLEAKTSVHFEDLIDEFARAGLIDIAALTDGVIGSVMVVFNKFTKSGQGAVTARIQNPLGGGSVGLAIRGHELTAPEPQSLAVTLRDTRGNGKNEVEMYPNLFINHMGVTPAGGFSTTPVTVEVKAVSASTGASIGQARSLTIQPGQVGVIGSVFDALQIPRPANDTILVYARVTSGNAAIQGLISQVDQITRDGSAFEMARMD